MCTLIVMAAVRKCSVRDIITNPLLLQKLTLICGKHLQKFNTFFCTPSLSLSEQTLDDKNSQNLHGC